jgi:hypothetical protein
LLSKYDTATVGGGRLEGAAGGAAASSVAARTRAGAAMSVILPSGRAPGQRARRRLLDRAAGATMIDA